MEVSTLENITWSEQRAEFHARRMKVQTQIRENHKLTISPTPANTPTYKTTHDKPWNELHWNQIRK